MKKAVFLDRDGIINIDHSYVYKQEDFEFNEGIFEVCKHMESKGYILIVVTNQSGIGRGYYSEKDFDKLTKWMLLEFKKRDILISKVYHCPHTPDFGCTCRKPKTGMFEQAKLDFEIDMKNSWMIGDKTSDIEAGINAGIENTIFVNNSTCKDAKYSVNSILDIIKTIKA